MKTPKNSKIFENFYKFTLSIINLPKYTFLADGYNEKMVQCGSVPGTFPVFSFIFLKKIIFIYQKTVDFGAPQTLDSASKHFEIQRKFSGGGPNVNSEFYTTWFSMWGDSSIPKQNIKNVISSVEVLWTLNASFRL